jgi:BMFP domain-containing protein YqiC
MPTISKRVPSALKHGIYSGLGVLPTESRAKFRKFRKQIFTELNLVGRLEEDIGEQIVLLEWRRKNLATYDLAQRARALRAAIHSELIPPVRYLDDLSFALQVPEPVPDPENPTPKQLKAARRRADKKIQIELGAALALAELGDVVTFDHLDKRLAVEDRLDETITRRYKRLAFIRAIKSMAPAQPASTVTAASGKPPLRLEALSIARN